MIAITGATGQLGRLVIKELLETYAPSEIIAAVRQPEKAAFLRDAGVQIRHADYDRPSTLDAALVGVKKLLLISAVEPGERLRQHTAVVESARKAGVHLLAYTSILRANTSTIVLAEEHKATEEMIVRSGLPYVFLRNGWYLENHTSALPAALHHGVLLGSSGSGRFASASRADYAAAAAKVLTGEDHHNRIYELAGDSSFDMIELAAEVSRQAGRTLPYQNLTQQEFGAILLGVGIPQMFVDVVSDADEKAQAGQLDSTSKDLSELIARPTTSLERAVEAALREANS